MGQQSARWGRFLTRRWSDQAIMSYLATVDPEEAEGLLRRLYSAAIRRAGRVFNILRVQSPRPKILRASTQLYMEVMHSEESGLSRAQREMIATVASRETGCFY